MYEFLFLDLDDTILDFHKAERLALSKTLRSLEIEPTGEVLARYHAINRRHWQMLERGELTREQVLLGRFETLFRQLGLTGDAAVCAERYEENLSVGHYFLPGAEAALERLSGKYRLFLASNGTAKVQAGRMKSANLYRFFEQVFVSQELGADKPSREFFLRCFARIPDFDRAKAMMVGDSLTSDMLGANNAGIAACWVNPGHSPGREGICVDYEIEKLADLEGMLEKL